MRKNNILPPDTFVRDNIKFIRMLGKKATNVDIVKMVRDEAVRQHISVGCEYSEAQRLADEYLQRGSTADQMFMLLCGNNWYWGGRQVYRFDDTLSELLSSQTKEDIEIDVSAISQLPCSDFFVMRSSGDSLGFFVSVADDNIIFGEMFTDGMSASYIPINQNGTLKEILNNMLSDVCDMKGYTDDINHMAKKISEKLQYVVYLAAVNAEIVPVTKGAVTKKASTATRKPTSRTFKTEISDVGYRIGSTIRQNRARVFNETKPVSERHGTPKAPHIRRSHFHSFWTGSGEDKKLIIKWVNTVFVNADKGSDVTTLHDVNSHK